MDWIKVYGKHYLFSQFTDEEMGSLIKIQLITAQLERLPNEDEIRRHVHYKRVTSIQDKLNAQSTSLQEVLNKVLTDVQRHVNDKTRWKENKRKLREKHDGIHEESSKILPLDKIRLDKIREDKIIYHTKDPILSQCSSIPSVLTYITKHSELEDDDKKQLKIEIQGSAKHPGWSIYEIHEQIDAFVQANKRRYFK